MFAQTQYNWAAYKILVPRLADCLQGGLDPAVAVAGVPVWHAGLQECLVRQLCGHHVHGWLSAAREGAASTLAP